MDRASTNPSASAGTHNHGIEPDTGLMALVTIAAHYRISVQSDVLARELAIVRTASTGDIHRAAKSIKLKSRSVILSDEERLHAIPVPAIACFPDGSFAIYAGMVKEGICRVIEPVGLVSKDIQIGDLLQQTAGNFILVQRRFAGPGIAPQAFGFRWFLPSLFRYRRAFGHVLLASLFVQIFALVTPLFFQVVVDKVLAHRS